MIGTWHTEWRTVQVNCWYQFNKKSHQVIAMNSLVLGKSRTVDASGLVEKNQVNCGLRPQPREQMAKSLLWKIHFWQIQEAD